jgi:hypothetical protein
MCPAALRHPVLEGCLARAPTFNADFKHQIDARPANAERPWRSQSRQKSVDRIIAAGPRTGAIYPS